jgi:hypothetical protein
MQNTAKLSQHTADDLGKLAKTVLNLHPFPWHLEAAAAVL